MTITSKYKKSDVINDINYCLRSIKKHNHSIYFAIVMMYRNKGYKKDLLDPLMIELLSEKTNIPNKRIESFLNKIALGRKG